MNQGQNSYNVVLLSTDQKIGDSPQLLHYCPMKVPLMLIPNTDFSVKKSGIAIYAHSLGNTVASDIRERIAIAGEAWPSLQKK